MLSELRVRQLGVIEDVTLNLGPGMTALTGETGAGKTLVVEAIELLLGGRGDPELVRAGAAEAVVEARFDEVGRGDEAGRRFDAVGEHGDLVLARAIPADGRSRAYVGGRMANLGLLGEAGRARVDLHGQHASQSLLVPAVQRAALDQAGGIDPGPLLAARARVRAIDQARAGLGGDARSRARELDLLRFQLDELDAARLENPAEDAALAEEEERLGDAESLRLGVEAVHEALAGDGGVLDQLGPSMSALAGRAPVAALYDRLRDLEAELTDLVGDSRALSESLEDNPARLEEVSARRHTLGELRRKYGESLADVIDFRDDVRRRVSELESFEERAAQLDAEAAKAAAKVVAEEQALGEARRGAAPPLGAAIEAALHLLALPRAHFEVDVADGRAGEEVTWLFAANPGEPLLPLTKVASGGELARTMLAARLVLSGASASLGVSSVAPGRPIDPSANRVASAGEGPLSGHRAALDGPRTLVFDEVDAGIGGEAAVAVGRALAALGRDHQVLVVTHLPQVAAFARAHLAVTKEVAGDRTVSRVTPLDDKARVVELSRMLSGRPDSATARRHAEELLAGAGDQA